MHTKFVKNANTIFYSHLAIFAIKYHTLYIYVPYTVTVNAEALDNKIHRVMQTNVSLTMA